MDTDDVSANELENGGDVILHCATEIPSATKYKILTSSSALSRLSKVFEVMFSNKFREGAALTKSKPILVALPEDGSEAMLILCKIAHLRSHELPDHLPLTKVIDVINLARKYLCLEAVYFAAWHWMSNRQPDDTEALGRKLTICWHLQADWRCELLARDIVNCSTYHTKIVDEFTMYGIGEGEYGREKPGLLFRLLKKYKDQQWSKIIQKIDSVTETLDHARAFYKDVACDAGCFVAEVAAYEWKQYKRENELEPDGNGEFEKHSLSGAISLLERAPNYPFSERCKPCGEGCIHYELLKMNEESFQAVAKEVTTPKKLICMPGLRKNLRACYGGVGGCNH